MEIVKINSRNKQQIIAYFIKNWSTDFMVTRGKKHYIQNLEGYFVYEDNCIIGLLT